MIEQLNNRKKAKYTGQKSKQFLLIYRKVIKIVFGDIQELSSVYLVMLRGKSC